MPVTAFCLALASVMLGQTAVFGQSSSDRKIPIKRYRGESSPEVSGDVVQVADQRAMAEQYPVPMRPGEITGIEIRNGSGEIISGELAEGEFIVGPRPEAVHIGAPYGSTIESPPPFQAAMVYGDGAMPIEHFSEGCTSCDSPGCDGGCGSGARGGSYDPRVEAIAHVLAHPLSDFWVRAEYLKLSIDGGRAPALLTTGNSTSPRESAGVIGQPGTRVLFGDQLLNDGDRNGGRIEIGKFIPGDVGLALSASIFFTDDDTETYSTNSSAFPVLARPFLDASPTSLGSAAQRIAFPGEVGGDVDIASTSSFGGADVLGRALLISNRSHQLQTYIGYQYLSLDDDLSIRDFKRFTGESLGNAIGTTIEQADRFSTTNDFHGVVFGGQSSHHIGGWSLMSSVKLGLGMTDSTVSRSGSMRSVVPVPSAGGATTTSLSTTDSGLLVQDSNRGQFSDNEFSVAPELRIVLQRELLDRWNVTLGYEFLYWSRVLRAGDQIDPLVNLSQLSPGGLQGLARPASTVIYDDVLIHGISFGLFKEF